MKKIFKIFFVFLIFFVILGLSKSVKANSIKKISMDIYVDDQGDATVTEVWTCNTTQGTEVYHPYYNLGNSVIKDLEVEENQVKYTTLSSWDTSGSLSSKANKCGIHKISNGVELCWGITNYGSHVYTVKYTITNFVASLNDSQMIYWNLIPYKFSNSIGNVYIKIHTNFDIPDSVGVWGYGNYGGTAYVYDGYIEMQSDGSLSTSEYMTILVKFPSGTFKTNNKINKDFNYYLEMANEGTTQYKKPNAFLIAISMIFVAVIQISIWIALYYTISKAANNSSTTGKIKLGKAGKISKDVPYFRDIPCNGDIYRAYYIGYQYGILKSKTDILGAIILKWLKESKIRVEQKDVGSIFKKENTTIVLNEVVVSLDEVNPESIINEKEKRIFNMLYEASEDGILEKREFEKWCQKSYSRILKWFDDIIKEERDKLVNEGFIRMTEKVSLKIFKSKVYEATPELKEEATRLAGLKKYLKDYTLIKDRKSIEVTLFEDYLIYAQIMGIAKHVAKEFKDLYPDIIEQSNFTSYDNIVFINLCATRGIMQANSAKARAQGYSSGGGGFSSGGGGGGAFGGGGGGGGFR